MTDCERILHQLDRLIDTHSVLHHPFHQAWSVGELRQEALAIYAWVYYPHVAAFPNYIERAMKWTQDPDIYHLLEENLEEELGEPYAHHELWLQFAAGLGISRHEVLDAEPVPEVEQAVKIFRRLCDQGSAPALAALYTYESQQPELSASKIQGLREHYHIHDARTLAYFEVHQEADQRHREEARWALQQSIQAGTPSHVIFEAAQTALDANWNILDGVCHQAGISC